MSSSSKTYKFNAVHINLSIYIIALLQRLMQPAKEEMVMQCTLHHAEQYKGNPQPRMLQYIVVQCSAGCYRHGRILIKMVWLQNNKSYTLDWNSVIWANVITMTFLLKDTTKLLSICVLDFCLKKCLIEIKLYFGKIFDIWFEASLANYV